jgi:capsular polysaccharide biosynthesis protein
MNELDQQQIVEEEGMTLQDLFKIIWKNIVLIAFITLWVAVIGVVYTLIVVTPKYTANTSIIVQVDVGSSGASEQSAIYVAQNLINTYKEFVTSNLVLNSVLTDLDAQNMLPAGTTISQLRSMVTVSTQTNVLIIYIAVENTDPTLAAAIANEMVSNSIAMANDTEQGFVLLQNKLKALDTALVPTAPSSPNKILNGVISVLLGGIIALGVVFVKELFNNKIRSTEDMEKYLNLKVIAAVPGTVKERKLVD